MARTMLDEYKTPRKFWAEAINTACYISNQVFLISKLGKTSYELRFGHQPKVSHLRVFGCKCFVLKSRNLDKFEARSTDGLFLGYPAHTRGYRVLILETNKIVETCEVSFDEASPDESDNDNDDDEVGSAVLIQNVDQLQKLLLLCIFNDDIRRNKLLVIQVSGLQGLR
uniref:Polyprotein n=1 Tax=Oryza sativa subsp. japonica TaxID=39947 RepID=Q84MT4_ORYSJ|nr:putative polyprotein [Oryza sativa Japonica Group]